MFDQVVVDDQPACGSKFYDDYFHVVANPLYVCEHTLESFGLVLEFEDDDMCKYKSDYSFNFWLDTQGEQKIHDIYD